MTLKVSNGQIMAIKQVANQNIEKVFQFLGITDFTSARPGEIRMPCPIHEGDNDTALCWYRGTGIFVCYTKGCHNKGKDVYGLLSQVLAISFYDSIKLIIDMFDIDLETLEYKDYRDDEWWFNQKSKEEKEVVPISEDDWIKQLGKTDYLEKNKGFPDWVSSKYEVGAGSYHLGTYGRIVVPVRDENGVLIGYTSRDNRNRDKKFKWIHSDNLPTSRILYNLNNAKRSIKDTQIAVITESPWEPMAFDVAGIPNVVSVFGVNLSDHHINLLMSSGAFYVVLAMDGDEAGATAVENAKKKLESYFEVAIMNIEDGKDPDDMKPEELQLAYNNALDRLGVIV